MRGSTVRGVRFDVDAVDGATSPSIAFGHLAAVCRRPGTSRRWREKRGTEEIVAGSFAAGEGTAAGRAERSLIIKTRWDRWGHSISSRTGARTFSFNPTGHHLSENFSIRFKALLPNPAPAYPVPR